MKNRILLLLLALASVASLNNVLAQGTAFTYQGQLAESGVPANGQYDFHFGVFNAATGGSRLGPDLTNLDVTVSSGSFSADLDFGAGIFTGPPRWLEISARTNGATAFTTLSPRQAILASPYAIMAGSASNLLGPLPAADLSSAYPGVVTFSNSANSFAGNGGGLTNVNAATLGGLKASSFWKTTGNSGTTPGLNFVGTTDNQPLELWTDGTRALRLQPNGAGVPNLIGGSPINAISSAVWGSVIGGGSENSIISNYCVVGGGLENASKGYGGFIGGGTNNLVTQDIGVIAGGGFNTNNGNAATISGGFGNLVTNRWATIGGGFQNVASNQSATVAGGDYNFATGENSAIGGGSENQASGLFAAIPGGAANTATEYGAAVGGGTFNSATADTSTVCGGFRNLASGEGSIVLGGQGNRAIGVGTLAAGLDAEAKFAGSFVWADQSNTNAFSDTVPNGFFVRCTGGVKFVTAIDSSGAQTAGVKVNGGGTSWVTICDRNAKKNFAPIDSKGILEKLASIPVQQWNYKWEPDTDTPHIGPMAQDFTAAFYPGTDDKGISTLEFDGVELAAIQGLNQKLEEERAKNSALEQRVEKLERLLEDRLK